MKKLIIVCFIALTLPVGCITKKAGTDPNLPPSYVVDLKAITEAKKKAQEINQALGPVNPYSGLTSYGIEAAAGLATLISLGVAWVKTNTARKKDQVASTFAAAIAQLPPEVQKAILDHASYTPSFPEVAAKINDATP